MKTSKIQAPGSRECPNLNHQKPIGRPWTLKLGASIVLVGWCLVFAGSALAQGTAFTYQGQLQDNGSPANGAFDLRFTLFDTNMTGKSVAGPVTNSGVTISNGLFTVAIDFGADVWNGETNWLEISVETNGGGSFTRLSPRQQVTPTPYAITAENLGSGGLSGTYGGMVTLSNAANQFTGAFTGDGSALTNVNADTLGGLGAASFWQLGGNTAPGGSQIIGTLNNQPLDLYAVGLRALRLNFHVDSTGEYSNAPDIIGGSSINLVKSGVVGGTIGGGGGMDTNGISYPNQVSADFGTISGGASNNASGVFAFVGGGYNNTAGGSYCTVAGGTYNVAGGSTEEYATVSGGELNVMTGDWSVIAGGFANASGAAVNVVGGGWDNTDNAEDGVIGGGQGNYIDINAVWSSIGGGLFNSASNSDYETIAGGFQNQASAEAATIGGGTFNQVLGIGSFIGGGGEDGTGSPGNFVQANAASIVGGMGNAIQSGARYASIGGGAFNTNSGFAGTISGGWSNLVTGKYATVAGGLGNIASGEYSVVAGGVYNTASGIESFAAGGVATASHTGSFVWGDGTFLAADTGPGQFVALATGGFYFYTGLSSGAKLDSGATSWTTICDRNAKKNFQPVDTVAVLNKLATLPIEQWNYKWEKDSDTPNIGPMAQDFKAAFYPGRDDKGINTLEFDGVELAAIQGLNKKLEAGDQKSEARSQKTQNQIEELKAENVELKEKNDSLEKRLEALEQIIESQIERNNP